MVPLRSGANPVQRRVTLQARRAERCQVSRGTGVVTYDNWIADFAPPLLYIKACLKGGALTGDIHTVGGQSVAGGMCEPGYRRWIIERDERAAISWEAALLTCLLLDMRLPQKRGEVPFVLTSYCQWYEPGEQVRTSSSS